MYQPSCVFTSSIGYVGGPGSGTAMLAVELLVAAEWRAPNGSVMALKLHHDRFQSAVDGSMRPGVYPWPLGLCSLYHVRQHRPVSAALTLVLSCLSVCPSHFLKTRLQVRPLNGCLQLIA